MSTPKNADGLEVRVQTPHRGQMEMHLLSLDEAIRANHPVRNLQRLFATIEGIGSARRLAELCERDFAYRWICGGVGVNRDLLSCFRSSHPAQLDAILTDTLGILLHQPAKCGPRWHASASLGRKELVSHSERTACIEPLADAA